MLIHVCILTLSSSSVIASDARSTGECGRPGKDGMQAIALRLWTISRDRYSTPGNLTQLQMMRGHCESPDLQASLLMHLAHILSWGGAEVVSRRVFGERGPVEDCVCV